MKKISIAKLLISILWILLIVFGLSQNFMIFLTILFFASIILGPFYCGWLCPFGFIQDITNKIAKKANIKQLKIPKDIHNILKYLKYLLFVLLLFPLGSFLFSILKYGPRSNFDQLLKSEILAIVSIIVIIAFLITSLFNSRFFCKYLCIEGAKYSAFSFGRIFNIHRTSKCVECGKCTNSCPMQIDIQKQNEVKDMTCINCMECITSCNIKDAIVFKPTINYKKIILLCLSVALFTIYMLYTTKDSNNINEFVTDKNTEPSTQNELTQVEIDEDKVLTGSANGFIGIITVEVTMNGDKISDIQVTDHNDDIQWFNQAIKVIDKMLDSQSTDVDTVSGATYSSRGIINATKDALSQNSDVSIQDNVIFEVVDNELESKDKTDTQEQQAQIDSSDIDAELLTGSANGFKGTVTVEVAMNGDEISDIQIISHQDDEPWFNEAISVIDRILGSQSTDVDTVSGATYSSRGIINATKDALGQDFEEQSSSGKHGKGRGNH